MPEMPNPELPESPAVVRQYHLLNARRQFRIPSQHQLLSDAYATLGGELERLRCLEEDQHRTEKEKVLIYKQSCIKAEALGKLVRALQALRQEERIAAAMSVGGKPVDDYSDGEVLQMLLENAGPQAEAVLADMQSRIRPGATPAPEVARLKPVPYKRERGPFAAAKDAGEDTSGQRQEHQPI